MAKTTDVPANLREFIKVFNRVANYRWDSYTVFSDFVQYSLECFNLNKDEQWLTKLRETYGSEYEVFPLMFREMALTMQRELEHVEWFDVLGTIYEVVASSSKKSSFGQFFTPASVCDMMVQINVPDDLKGRRINDPACGSGRTLLAVHAARPGNFCFGEDLDPLCARMAVVNFCLHGVRGQVCHMDTLSGEVFRVWQTETLCCFEVPKEQSFTWQSLESMRVKPAPEPVQETPSPKFTNNPPAAPGVQLSIF